MSRSLCFSVIECKLCVRLTPISCKIWFLEFIYIYLELRGVGYIKYLVMWPIYWNVINCGKFDIIRYKENIVDNEWQQGAGH